MIDLHVVFANQPGELARFGRLLGGAGISLEGGGVFHCDGESHAHFLVAEGERGAGCCWPPGLTCVRCTVHYCGNYRNSSPVHWAKLRLP